MDLIEIIKQKDSLNLEVAQRRIILIALMKTGFDIKRAFKINCENSSYTMNSYQKMIYAYFPIGIKKLKKLFEEQFDFEDNLSVNLIKIKAK